MIEKFRNEFNERFTADQYEDYLSYIKEDFPDALDFRVAETPIFIPDDFKQKLLETCNSILDVIKKNDFKTLTDNAIPQQYFVKGDEGKPNFLIFDFGICQQDGEAACEPKLIEMQAFPSLFAYQLKQYEAADRAYELPKDFTPYFDGLKKQDAIELLKRTIIGEQNPEQVVLLELFPEKQKTRIDFYYTRRYLGLEIVCLMDLILENNKLYYLKDNRKIQIKRIYNRLIFDELTHQSCEVREKAKILFENIDVKWVTHPNWFYRISKYTLPLLDHPNVPQTWYLNKIKEIPHDLENYVLKPLFSFAGKGVIIDVKKSDIDNISDKENYILQRKVNYAPVIRTPDGMAKAEIRVFYFWHQDEETPKVVYNLARLTKGNMISVALNKNSQWVGGSFALFQE